MRKIIAILFLVVLPGLCHAQFVGIGGQYSQGGDGQFFGNLSYPSFHAKNKLNTYVSSGVEYTTPGGAKLSGLNIKPIQITTFFNEDFYEKSPVTLLLGVDAGYLLNFKHGQKDAITISPNLYADYHIFFVKTGYDFDILHGRRQFFVRGGIGIGLGTFKWFANTKVW